MIREPRNASTPNWASKELQVVVFILTKIHVKTSYTKCDILVNFWNVEAIDALGVYWVIN